MIYCCCALTMFQTRWTRCEMRDTEHPTLSQNYQGLSICCSYVEQGQNVCLVSGWVDLQVSKKKSGKSISMIEVNKLCATFIYSKHNAILQGYISTFITDVVIINSMVMIPTMLSYLSERFSKE